MKGWVADKVWTDALLPDVKAILGRYLIGAAPVEEDQQRNTDLIVLTMSAVRIACRIRRFPYLARYPFEFTVRAGRPSGMKTELAKILEGWGDYLFYGFADANGESLASWVLGDLKVFRLWFHRGTAMLPPGQCPGEEQTNADHSSSFRAFRLPDLPPDFIIGWAAIEEVRVSSKRW